MNVVVSQAAIVVFEEYIQFRGFFFCIYPARIHILLEIQEVCPHTVGNIISIISNLLPDQKGRIRQHFLVLTLSKYYG